MACSAFAVSAGIIPARAGFTGGDELVNCHREDHPRSRGVYSPTESMMRKPPIGTDHPRSRGVYPSHYSDRSLRTGSSPLARGLRESGGAPLGDGGIIPARAGFTMRSWKCLLPLTDHPRSRGVYWWDPQASSEVGGSSPLARGLHLRQERMSPQLRIIPARAGFTLADPWNPNDEPHYQTAFAFTDDLTLAPQSSDSAVVSQRSTRTPSEA